jgi:gas vesicle protein
MRDTKITIALLAGLAAGAVLGILFAPDEGSETRDKLIGSLTKLGESIKGSGSERIDNLVDFFNSKIVAAVWGKSSGAATEGFPDDLEHA